MVAGAVIPKVCINSRKLNAEVLILPVILMPCVAGVLGAAVAAKAGKLACNWPVVLMARASKLKPFRATLPSFQFAVIGATKCIGITLGKALSLKFAFKSKGDKVNAPVLRSAFKALLRVAVMGDGRAASG